MAGGRQHVDTVAATAAIGAAGDFVVERTKGLLHQLISGIVVVAVAGGFFPRTKWCRRRWPSKLSCRAVTSSGRVIFSLCIPRCRWRRGCRKGTDADALDIAGVVASAACIVVLAVGDAVVYEAGEKGHRHIAGIKAFDDLIAFYFDICHIVQLLFISLIERVKIAERSCFTGCWGLGVCRSSGQCR